MKQDDLLLKTYNRYRNIMEYPSLITHQLDSFQDLKDNGIPRVLREVSPILSDDSRFAIYFPDRSEFTRKHELEFRFDPPSSSVNECIENGTTYAVSMIVDVLMKDNITGKIWKSRMYFGELPQMTQYGSFVINGTEKVVITQLVKSPGVYFNAETGTVRQLCPEMINKKSPFYNDSVDPEKEFTSQHVKIVPEKGPHIDIYTRIDNSIFVEFDRETKVPLTTFLRMFSMLDDKTKGNPVSGDTNTMMSSLDRETSLDSSVYLIPTVDAEKCLYDEFTPENAAAWMWKNRHPTGDPDINYIRNRFEWQLTNLAAYDFQKVGRNKLNKRLMLDGIVPETQRNLTGYDLLRAVKELILCQSNGRYISDDIDHFANRRTRSAGELILREFAAGVREMEVNTKNKLKFMLPSEILSVEHILDPAPVNRSVHRFFATSQLCQFMDQNNPLAEIRHKRTISALGPGGLDRSRAGFDVRDIHHTHYGRVCPVETPEGKNSGLVNRYSVYAKRNQYGFLETPYRIVKKTVKLEYTELLNRVPTSDVIDEQGNIIFTKDQRITKSLLDNTDLKRLKKQDIPVRAFVTDQVIYIDAEKENPYMIALSTARLNEYNEFMEERINCRHFPEFLSSESQSIDLLDISPQQSVGVSAGCIPFLEHDDGHRALMGTNMQAQAVPLLYPERPWVITGMERYAALDSNQILRTPVEGTVIHAEGDHIDIVSKYNTLYRFPLRKYRKTNQLTCVNQAPFVETGDTVEKGDVIADAICTEGGMTALGHNPVIAFLTWDGNNFEDAIIVSEKLIKEDRYTSLDILQYEATAGYTSDAGIEEITKDIPNVKEENLEHLDDRGIAKIGTLLKGGDIIIGKVVPKRIDDYDEQNRPEEGLIAALFGKAANKVKDRSVRLPQGMTARVIDVKVFTHEENPDLPPDVDMLVRVTVAKRRKIEIGDKMSGRHGNKGVVSRIVPVEDMPYTEDGTPVDILLNPLGVPGRMNVGQILEVWLGWAAYRLGMRCETPVFDSATVHDIEAELARAWIYDKAWEDLCNEAWDTVTQEKALRLKKQTFVDDRYHDIFSNTLLGRIEESALRFDTNEDRIVLDYLSRVTNIDAEKIYGMTVRERKEAAAVRWIKSYGFSPDGVFQWDNVPENTPENNPADSAAIEICLKIWMLREGYKKNIPDGEEALRSLGEVIAKTSKDPLPITGKQYLTDGRTGEKYDHPSNVGVMNMIKLHHLVEDKVQGRSTATYSMITQQPLGGKAKNGGQRIGEMEVWALQGHGAAELLQEMLTIKSDDVDGRRIANWMMQRGLSITGTSAPGSFNVLVHELMSLCLNIYIDYRNGERLIFGQYGNNHYLNLKTGEFRKAEKPEDYTDDFDTPEREEVIPTDNIETVGISLASPEMIRSWSCGEVTKPDMIDMKTMRPVPGGLFCEAIFGPIKDYSCACGRYKGQRFEGVICEECGTIVAKSKVRRERMGHIDLAAPAAHVWYSVHSPSPICLLLDISLKDIKKILYCTSYVILHVNEEARQKVIDGINNKDPEMIRREAQKANHLILQEKKERDRKIDGYMRSSISEEEKGKAISNVKRLCEENMEKIRNEYEAFCESCSVDGQLKLELLEDLRPGQLLSEKKYRIMQDMFDGVFDAGIGAEAIRTMLQELDLPSLIEEMKAILAEAGSSQQKKQAAERLKIAEAFQKSGNKPEWMILDAVPVIPADLRPMIEMDNGTFACSDLNEHYKSIVNRNNRLKRMLQINAPEGIINQEKRMLQEAVDQLIDKNGSGKKPPRGAKPLATLSSILKGKRGRFRKNLLGKRVDYSGRSVIVVGPKLRMWQCGIPKVMALEMYKPFVIAWLVKNIENMSVRRAKNMIKRRDEKVWYALSQVVGDHPVILNRAPSLHRLSMLAFEPVLIEGNAIQLHPLVCASFNADFDGDQMAVHLPLGEKPVKEAREIMLASKNLLKPSDGEPIISPSKDMVLGIYYLTMDIYNGIVTSVGSDQIIVDGKTIVIPKKVEMNCSFSDIHLGDYVSGVSGSITSRGRTATICNKFDSEELKSSCSIVKEKPRSFYSANEVIFNYEAGLVHIHDIIYCLLPTWYDADGKRLSKPELRVIETTVGRVLFNEIIPEELRFKNETYGKGGIKDLIAEVFDTCGEDVCAVFGDSIKDIGFKYSMLSGLTMSVSDITVPPEGRKLKEEANQKVDIINNYYKKGYLCAEERDELTINVWRSTNALVSQAVKNTFKPDADMAIMANSGASKGGFGPIGQLAGMRGLMADPSGRIITLPVKSNLKEGMDALEYFVATHGARKGLADTALKTADAGYLTRRLVDVTHDLIITEEDCGTEDGIVMRRKDNVEKQKYSDRLYGRTLAEDVIDPESGELYGSKGDILTHSAAEKIDKSSVQEVKVYSPITCRLKHGICRKCYGLDIAKNKKVSMGTPVGTIGAQSIGEPGTQLTLRTFHSGGVAAGGDITNGLPRVEELFEARPEPKGLAVITEVAGKVSITEKEGRRGILVTAEDENSDGKEYQIDEDTELFCQDGDTVEKGDILFKAGRKSVKAGKAGRIQINGDTLVLVSESSKGKFYDISAKAKVLVQDGDFVTPGDQLTAGALNPHKILKYKGREACQMYILQQVQNVYIPQGQSINVKHFELLIRKMFEKVLIKDSGDSPFSFGDLVNGQDVKEVNEKLLSEGKAPADYEEVLLGISRAALMSDSWLSAASFQHTVKVLTDCAIKGKKDSLNGIKENIILGKVIPAGSGFVSDIKDE